MFGFAAAGPQLQNGLELSKQGLGIMLASMPLGLMLGTFAWGKAADRFGERYTLTVAWLFVVIASIISLPVSNLIWHESPSTVGTAFLWLLLLMIGAAGSSTHSAGGRAVTEAFPEHVHGLVLSIRHTFIPIGGAIGGMGVPWLLNYYSLQTTMLISSSLSAVVLVFIFLVVPSEDTSSVDNSIAGDLQLGVSPLKKLDLWLLTGSCSLFALVQLGLMSFLTVNLVDEARFAIASAAMIFGIAQLVGAAGRISLGFLSDYLNDPIRVLLWLSSLGFFIGIASMFSKPRYAGVLLALQLAVFTSWNGVAIAAAARLSPLGRMGATLGMQTTFNAAMGVVAPIGVGALLTIFGWGSVKVAIIVALLFASLGLLFLRKVISSVGYSYGE